MTIKPFSGRIADFMPIRLKLLLLLLVIALPPLLAVAWFDAHSAQRIGLDLAARSRLALEEKAEAQLLQSIAGTARVVRSQKEYLEIALALQAHKVMSDLGAPERIRQSLAALAETHAGAALSQRVFLVSGQEITFPAASSETRAREMPRWAEQAKATGGMVWNLPSTDPATGLAVLTLSMPLLDDTGAFLGATALDVTVGRVLAEAESQWPAPARALLVGLDGPGNSIRVIAERTEDGRANGVRTLDEGDGASRAEVIADMKQGRAQTRRLSFQGEDSLWAYGPVDDDGANLLLVVPYGSVVADAEQAEDFVQAQIETQLLVTIVSLIVFVPAVMGLALIASRAVTRPIHQLADAARNLAQGDFETRTDIRSKDELEELGHLFNFMVPQLRERMRLREAMGLAQEVQRNLLPAEPPCIPGFDLAGSSLYCDETGGDYYDFFDLSESGQGPGQVAVAVGDVSGHGVAAALVMASVRALLRSRVLAPGQLARVMGEVNAQLSRDTLGGRFMTLFIAIASGADRSLCWVSAGHDPAVTYHPAEDVFREVAGADIPLGIDAHWAYHELSHQGWTKGDILLVGTDGIWETRDPAGQMFGKDRLNGVLRDNAARSATEIVQAVTQALAEFRQGAAQIDDVTLLVVKATN